MSIKINHQVHYINLFVLVNVISGLYTFKLYTIKKTYLSFNFVHGNDAMKSLRILVIITYVWHCAISTRLIFRNMDQNGWFLLRVEFCSIYKQSPLEFNFHCLHALLEENNLFRSKCRSLEKRKLSNIFSCFQIKFSI